MNMSNFDSLKAAESLQDAGFEVQQAEAVVGTVTQALNENLATQDDVRELSEKMATQDDLRELSSRLDVLENKVAALDSRLEAIEAQFEIIDARFEAINTRLDAIDHKFEAVNTRLDAIDLKFEALNTNFRATITNFEMAAKSAGNFIGLKFEAIDTNFKAINTSLKTIYARLDMLESKIDNLANDLIQKLTIRLGGMLLAAIVLLEILNRIFPVVPAP